MRIVHSLALALGFILAFGACGGSEPPPKTAGKPVEDDREGPSGSTLDVSAEIGALDESKVEKAFAGRVKSLSRCLDSGAKRVEFIGGQVAFFVKIDQHGKVAHAHLEKSSLGDRETEKCMLDALRAAEWPAPVGGLVGLARKGFDFDPPNDVRPPTDWDGEKASGALGSRSTEIEKCKGSSAGSFTATLYVSQTGKVLAAGVTPPDETGEAAVDCLVEVIKGTKFPSPGSWPAKVSVEL
ncbi:MAG: AgmX/PglI C-terminal domain-containing protein [Polyangiaceae bacterium]|nr:AgmX/PglI C-terminal domain-containing protein [Polyangiaceae bacterium]MCE7890180.1 hypothetical protein [Sorangiineae bacterium PRO1]MCL4754557.1 AgmX/PglI C-terminal domain-containing protein [Myxococcales bacterium]